jgi:hypothetical protein
VRSASVNGTWPENGLQFLGDAAALSQPRQHGLAQPVRDAFQTTAHTKFNADRRPPAQRNLETADNRFTVFIVNFPTEPFGRERFD